MYWERGVLPDFFQQLYLVHPLLGHLAEWTAIGLLLTISLFLISIPAHIIAESMRGPVAAAAALFAGLAAASMTKASALFDQVINRPTAFARLARYKFVFDHHERTLRRDLKAIEQAARNFPEAVNSRTAALEAGTRRLADQMETLINLEVRAARPEIPDLDSLKADSTAYRSALGKFVIALIFAPALIAINTFVLQEFFRGIVTIYVVDIPLSWILSVFFSMLELGLGIWIYAQQQKAHTGDIRSVIAELAMFAAVLALAGVEFFFYSILSAQIDPAILSPLFAPNPIPHWALFWLAPLGPVIVLVLAFTGHALIEGWDGLRHGATARNLRRQLSAIQTAGSKMIEEFEVAKVHAKELGTQAREYRNEFIGTDNQPPGLSVAVDQAVERLTVTAQSIAQARREPHVALEEGESARLYYTYVLLAFAGLCVLWIFFYIQMAFLPRLGPISPRVAFIVAIAETVVVLGASYVLAHAARIVIEETEAKIVATPRDWVFGGVAVAAIVAVIGFNLFLILHEGTAGEWLWVALAMACVGYMIYVGRSLGLLVAAVWNVMKGVSFAIAAAVAGVLAALFGICRAVLLLFNGLLAILSYPFQILMRMFRRSSPAATPAQ